MDLRQTSFYRYQALKKKTEDSCGCKRIVSNIIRFTLPSGEYEDRVKWPGAHRDDRKAKVSLSYFQIKVLMIYEEGRNLSCSRRDDPKENTMGNVRQST